MQVFVLVTLKIVRNFAEYCVQGLKTLLLRKAKEAKVAVNREKGREMTTFGSIMSFRYFCVASCNNNAILVGFNEH